MSCPKTCTCPPFTVPCQDHHGDCTPFFCVDVALRAQGKPEPEPVHKRVRRLETELAQAKEEMRLHNEATFRAHDEKLKRCNLNGGVSEHKFVLREYEHLTPTDGRATRTGKYHCGCGAKMTIEN